MTDELPFEIQAHVQALLNALLTDTLPSRTLLIYGAANSGKTTTALRAMLEGAQRYADGSSLLAVSNRMIASRLADIAMHKLRVSYEPRCVVTLASLAFRILQSEARIRGLLPVKLLNGAEQDALLRNVILTHIAHVERGDNLDCATCQLFAKYFDTNSWIQLCAPVISADFIHQLRDTIARFDELGIDAINLEQIRSFTELPEELRSRQLLNSKLASMLKAQYRETVKATYRTSRRLDASSLLVEGAQAVERMASDEAIVQQAALPSLLVVDDFHDVTLAGLRFLESLSSHGVRLVLVANPDESVQTFRGSYPDFVLNAAQHGVMHAVECSIASQWLERTQTYQAIEKPNPTLLDTVLSRVSLSIASLQETSEALPNRPWKMPKYAGTYPIAAVGTFGKQDNSVRGHIYASANEEIDRVMSQIKRAHLQDGYAWNDLALIAHDNATVRAFGDALEEDGVPVRYSSVKQLLRDEPFIQALFALIELAEVACDISNALRDKQPLQSSHMEDLCTINALEKFVSTRVHSIMESPLAGDATKEETFELQAKWSTAESVMASMIAMSAIVNDDETHGDVSSQSLQALQWLHKSWKELVTTWTMLLPTDDTVAVTVNDAIYNSDETHNGTGSVQTVNEWYAVALMDAARTLNDPDHHSTLCILSTLSLKNRHIRALLKTWELVLQLAQRLRHNPDASLATFALGEAWDVCNVAHSWQRQALVHTRDGRVANNRLDMAMRLFDYAATSDTAGDQAQGEALQGLRIQDFITQVRSMEIEADSLATLAPMPEAVTLTTPAGSVGQHFKRVWIVRVQQSVWPNTASRSTMFGTDILAQMLLQEDSREVFAGEQRAWLVALSRASDEVELSAISTDDTLPSDFLSYYVPEIFADEARALQDEHEADELAQRHEQLTYRGIVSCARSTIVKAINAQRMNNAVDNASERVDDALAALHVLKTNGVVAAASENWDFADAHNFVEDDASAANDDRAISIKPSKVDSLWACPVCGLMNSDFAGPKPNTQEASFGTIIHEIACKACKEWHADMQKPFEAPLIAEDGSITASIAQQVLDRIRDLSNRMLVEYRDRVAALDAANKEDLLHACKQITIEQKLRYTFDTIAQYFVTSAFGSNALGANAMYPLHYDRVLQGECQGQISRIAGVGTLIDGVQVGQLVESYCEVPIGANIDFAKIAEVYNRTARHNGCEALTVEELYVWMGYLVGGWPDGASSSMRVYLHGSVDRIERRKLADSETLRIIDYKTGKMPTAKGFIGDLQLICYQLGLVFADENVLDPSSQQPMPPISASMLFHTTAGFDYMGAKSLDYPAQMRNIAEYAYQPTMIENGMLNATLLHTRKWVSGSAVDFFDVVELPESQPSDMSDRAWNAWKRLMQEGDEQELSCAIWSLTMIARVMYAAAIMRSKQIVAHPTSEHVKSCYDKQRCTACNGGANTVYDVAMFKHGDPDEHYVYEVSEHE